MGLQLMGKRIEGLVKLICREAGSNPIVFLDTGAVLDFEQESQGWRLNDSKLTTNNFYNGLSERLRNMYITGDILEEILNHHENHKINGRKEVSKETYEHASRMFLDYLDFMREADFPDDFDFENVRHDVYWAGHLSFNPDHKKCYQDSISDNDRQLIADALATKYLIGNAAGDKTGTVIVSPDCHYSKTVDLLMGRHPEHNGIFKYRPVSVISTKTN